MEETQLAHRCPRCGRSLSADAPEGLCPACLLEAAAGATIGATSENPTVLSPLPPTPADSASRPGLVPGQRFGGYAIARMIGRGGMGEVYEAEHLESGRRVALKILRERLRSRDDRARFLREGQLAASISHPHTVYIFGSDEIDGVPVISMELLTGGTLRDLVATEGPLPYPRAVAAVLDIVGGLDAAQAAGILHRDIKPSNCFRDADGSVKIGDFGLSISTLARDVQEAAGPQGFQGTPQFAPPEQLRGQPLDVRADIYAVGATLYYLLTGAPPFEAADLKALVARVTSEEPRSPRAGRTDMPAGLAAVVLRCLAKNPAARYGSYAELAAALRPFAFADLEPARIGLRLLAGVVDVLAIGLSANLLGASQLTVDVQTAAGVVNAQFSPLTAFLALAYYLLFEGLSGATPGKRLFGLRVMALEGPAPFRRVFVRTIIFTGYPLAASIPLAFAGLARSTDFLSAHPALAIAMSATAVLVTPLLFSTARRRNGYGAVHDLVSGTRVVVRQPHAKREAGPAIAEPLWTPLPAGTPIRCGPYDVLGELGGDTAGRTLLGFDPALRRQVWIRALPSGTPAVSAARRDLARPTRLRWLAGRRAPGEHWDAYEAPAGAPFAEVAPQVDGWPPVRTWLVDLASELAASRQEPDSVFLHESRVWIRADGRAVLLDFAAPRTRAVGSAGRARSAEDGGAPAAPVELLARVGQVALRLRPTAEAGAGVSSFRAVPLAAARLIASWAARPALSIDEARLALAAVVRTPDRVAPGRRALPILLAAMPALLLTAGAFAVLPFFRTAMTAERFEAYRLLAIVNEGRLEPGGPTELQRAAAIYLAGHHGDVLTDTRFWSSSVARGNLRELRGVAEQLARDLPVVDAARLADAERMLGPMLEASARDYETSIAPQLPGAAALLVLAMVGLGLGVPLVASLVSAAVTPGGIVMRMLGLAVVTVDGEEVRRPRSVARALIAWSPVLMGAAWCARIPLADMVAAPRTPTVAGLVVLTVMAGGAIWSILEPARGPIGRATRTWVIPR
jgi:uncharacterized RDD family membrane protein YckC